MKIRFIAAASLAVLAGAAYAQPPGMSGPPGAPGMRAGMGFGLLVFDANGDGKLTRAEMDGAQRARFEAIDANKDGAAAPEEFQAFHDKERTAAHAEMAAARFTQLDTDKSGQLSKTEFAAGAPAREHGEDGPGKRGPGMRGDRKDIKMGMGGGPRRGPGPDGADGQRGMRGPDADADGTVSLAEFSAGATAAFTRADTNKDGVVTVTELQSLRPGR